MTTKVEVPEGLPEGSRIDAWGSLHVPHGYFEKPRKIDGWRCTFVGYFGIGREPEACHVYRAD